MSPTMDENDIVIVKKQNDISSGDIAIVCINGDEATCKKNNKTQGRYKPRIIKLKVRTNVLR